MEHRDNDGRNVILPRIVGGTVRILETVLLHEEVLGDNASRNASARSASVRLAREEREESARVITE